MLQEDVNAISNRSELIRKARESCTRGMNDTNPYSSKLSYNRRASSNETTLTGDVNLKVKFFLIRMVVALVLLTAVVIADQMKLSYEDMNSNQIINLIRSNRLYEQAKEYVNDFTNKEDKGSIDREDSENNVNQEQEVINQENVNSPEEETDLDKAIKQEQDVR